MAALLTNNHGDTIAEKPRCGNDVTKADCEALCKLSGDSGFV